MIVITLFTALLLATLVSGRPRAEVHRGLKEGLSAPKAKGPSPGGFGSPKPTTAPSKGGFGGGATKAPSGATSSAAGLEEAIQSKINSITGLRESMNLQSEIQQFEAATFGLTGVERAMRVSENVENTMRLKTERLQQLQNEAGMTEDYIHRTLHEITWDASAAIRDDRHTKAQQGGKNKKGKGKGKGRGKSDGSTSKLIISDAVTQHMMDISKWTDIQDRATHILDVGCGNGVLVKYLSDYYKDKNQWNEGYIGVDLSSEMIKVAQSNYPDCEFFKEDFLEYKPAPEQSFSVVVLNEILHYFRDVYQALSHANDMLCPGGRIIISHPKGYENVRLQRSKNRMLVANLLPSPQELEAMDLDKLKLQVKLPPNIASEQYLSVLEKIV